MGKSKADGFTQNGLELKWVKSVPITCPPVFWRKRRVYPELTEGIIGRVRTCGRIIGIF